MSLSLKRFGFPALGTYCEIQIYDESRVDAKNQVRRLSTEMLRLDQKYSSFLRDSLTTRINFSAGNNMGIKIDKETKKLLDRAQHYYQLSDGLFDITAGLLRRVWDFKKPRIPRQADIEPLLPRIGYDKLSWRGARLLLPPGMEVDFSHLLGGYAVDSAAALARDIGISQGLINLGGTFAVIGPQPEGKPWTVGVANPEQPKEVTSVLKLPAGGLASGGNFNGLLEHEGERYRFVLNPLTGWPGQGIQAISLVAESAMDAAALAQIAMLKSEAEALAWLAESGHDYIVKNAAGELINSTATDSSAVGEN